MAHNLTSHEPLPNEVQTRERTDPTDRESCIKRGGIWDPEAKTCSFTKEPPKRPDVKAELPETFRDPETGRESGITLPDGTTFLGLTQGDVDRVARQQAEIEARKINLEPVGTSAREQERLSLIDVERQRLIAEELPEQVELSPELTTAQKVPLIGGVLGLLESYLQPVSKLLGVPEKGLQPRELRTLAMTEIERKIIEVGLTESEETGRLFESVGFSKVDVFGLSAKDLVETPSENAVETFSKIRKQKRRISNIETNVRYGYLPVEVAQRQIADIDQEIQGGESRLRLLIYNSPELLFNSDFVNTMETEILVVREKLFQAKLNVLQGQTAQPTDTQIYQTLQDLDSELDENVDEAIAEF